MSRFSTIDLSQLPAPAFLETINIEEVLNRRMQVFMQRWAAHDPPNAAQYDVHNLEFDPVKINQEANTYLESTVRDRVNQAARAVTLAFSSGTDLDAIASRYPGGVPRLANEADARYRRRIWLSVNPLSPHGPEGAYEFWALSAVEGALRDVSVITVRSSPLENPVLIVTCLASGQNPKPTVEQLIAIRAHIQAESRQAMTDVIAVRAPKVREVNYDLRVWLYPGPDDRTVMDLVAGNLRSLIADQYWLGYDHTRDAIDKAARVPGVHSIEIVEPAANVEVPPDWVVQVNTIKVTLMQPRKE